MAESLGFIVSIAQIAGAYSIYAMFTGELYKLPVVLIVLGVLCAWCLLLCVYFLILSLVQFYQNLREEDPVALTFMHSSVPTSFKYDLKREALFLEGLVFMLAISPGESWRADHGYH